MWNQQGCPRHWLWPHGDGQPCLPVEVPPQSACGPLQPFLSCRTTGGWRQGGAWHWGSWLVLLGPRQTRPQAMGSCRALTTCSCPAVLWQINKRTSADKLSSVYPQGLLPEPATPAADQGVLQGAGLALHASLSPSSPWGLSSGALRRSEDSQSKCWQRPAAQ